MSFGISTWNMRKIASYEEADHYFNKTKKPRTHRWPASARPLRDTRSTHMALTAGEHLGVKCYDLSLYQTPLIRYFEPNADGERAVWLRNYPTTSTHKFMWAHDWFNGKQLLDENEIRCHVPIPSINPAKCGLWDDEFTAKVVLNSHGRLIRSKSVHFPTFRRSSTATMRARRKALREKIEVMLALLEMQFTELVNNADYDMWRGQPFASNKQHFPLVEHAMRGVQMLEKGGEPSPDDLTRLMEYFKHSAKEVIENTINKRLLQKYKDTRRWHGLMEGAPPEQGMFCSLSPDDQELARPTQADVCLAVVDRIVNMAGLHADNRVPMPQFPMDMPRTWFGPGSSDPDFIANLLGGDLYYKLTSRKGVVY